MAITSTDNQTAAAPAVEVPVANKTDSPPADEGEPKLETSKPAVTSRRLSAPAAAYRTPRRVTVVCCFVVCRSGLCLTTSHFWSSGV